jgi:hypothetical protein
MSVINTQPLIGASGNQGRAYNIDRSLRFRKSASTYLNRTPSSAGNRQKFTWSSWMKIGLLNSDGFLINAGNIVNGGTGSQDGIVYTADGNIEVNLGYTGGGYAGRVKTIATFRDPSAWYHVVVAIDTTQATAGNRCLIYVNGVSVPYTTTVTITQNHSTQINNTAVHNIGRLVPDGFGGAAWIHFDGYLAEMNHIDGQQLTPSSFGENDTITGVWKPKSFVGTYGTNGFYLPFTNITSTSTLGNDFSGNGHNWTTNNFSLTAGATYDSMTDVPTLTSATAANYCVLNPLLQNNWWAAVSRGPITNANLTQANSAGTANFATFDLSSNRGKWYYELNCAATDAQNAIVIAARARATFEVDYYQNGNKQTNGTTPVAYGATWTSGDVIGVAIDVPNGTFTFYKNNVSQGTITNAVPTNEPVYIGGYFNSASGTYNYNFGQRPFAYTPPSGFVALNTFNLPDSTIVAGNKVMDATLWTGNSASTRSITNAAPFKPDLVWIKSRSNAEWHELNDSVRGGNKILFSNATNTESVNDSGGYLSAFNSDGFTVTAGSSSSAGVNQTGYTYVGWQWQAGQGTNTTNTNGSITSTVSVNAAAGFSVVTYTGTGVSNATVGHGLGVAPRMIILKSRSTNSTSNNWWVNHASLSSGNNLYLNTTDAQFAVSGTTSGGLGTMSSTTFTLANGSSTNNNTNQSGGTFVAYCWSEIEGFSKFGSYTGNGSADGSFIYCGFKPKFVLVKKSSASGNDWKIVDTTRSPYNVTQLVLAPNTSAAEVTASSTPPLDMLSNGFKLRSTWDDFNGSGATYIFAAFSENPFKNALAA